MPVDCATSCRALMRSLVAPTLTNAGGPAGKCVGFWAVEILTMCPFTDAAKYGPQIWLQSSYVEVNSFHHQVEGCLFCLWSLCRCGLCYPAKSVALT